MIEVIPIKVKTIGNMTRMYVKMFGVSIFCKAKIVITDKTENCNV